MALAASESFAMETSARRADTAWRCGQTMAGGPSPVGGKILKMPFVPVKRNSYGKQISRHGGGILVEIAEFISEAPKHHTESAWAF